MITHIPTGKTFKNRLQAKIYFGHSNYNRLYRNGGFVFTEDSHSNPVGNHIK